MDMTVLSENYDYLGRKRLMDTLCSKYPFLKRGSIGKSCMGRDITSLQIGSGEEYCLISAAFHGSESITATVLLMFIENLCRAINEKTYISGIKAGYLLNKRAVIFVPCVNPDGCEISVKGEIACGKYAETVKKISRGDFAHWNANIRGVDINHNFPAGWEELKDKELESGIYCPAPTRYGGESPESEPETRALTELCRRKNIRHAVALHSQGEVIYYNYKNKAPLRGIKQAEILATASGYQLDEAEGLAEGGGFKDWFISEFNRPAFTVELGLGENPLLPYYAEEIYRKTEKMLMLCTVI